MRIARTSLAASIVWLSGCATIISTTRDDITITTEPPGARIVVNEGAQHLAPTALRLERGKKYTLLVSKDGYHSERVKIGNTLNPWVFGNILFGGVIGLVVDLVSGAVTDLTPTKIHVALSALGPSEKPEIRDWTPPKKSAPKPDAKKAEAAK